jgi:hypothetical protein
VFGSSPNIRRGVYRKVQNLSINQNGKVREYDNFTDEFDFNEFDKSTQRYEWTLQIVQAIKKMEKIGMTQLAETLNKKDFPKRFTDKIDLLMGRLPDKQSPIPHGDKPCSPQQISFLLKYSFRKDQVESLNKREAHSMIRTITGPEAGPFAIRDGRYVGLHIAETPFAYRNYIVKNYPASEIARLVNSWNNRQIA